MATISPKRKARHAVNPYRLKASGYGDAAAGWASKVWQGFFSTSSSDVTEDQDEHLPTLRERSRAVWYRSGLARCIIGTYCDWVLGSGLDLKSESSDKQAIEADFERWATSKDADARGDADFFTLSRQIFESVLLNGDAFVVLRRVYDSETDKVRLRLEAVESDVCTDPCSVGGKPIQMTSDDGRKRIVQGVELDKYGEAVAYHLARPDGSTKRVARYNRDGVQVLHIRLRERLGSVRGVPLLAPCLEPILQIERYMGSELQTALLESCFSVMIKTDEPDPDSILRSPDGTTTDGEIPSVYGVGLGSGNINFLPPDSEISSIDGHRDRGAGSLEKFVEVVLKTNICAALRIPYEILTSQFSSSYSASRASCLLFARRAEQVRDGFVLDFVQPVFEAWLQVREMNEGRPMAEDANRAAWIGPNPPSLDPNKTIAYLTAAIDAGLMTRQQAAYEISRTDFEANVAALRRENEALAEAQKPLAVSKTETTTETEEVPE